MIKPGDTIKCKDREDMIKTMLELAIAGIQTDFDYSEEYKLMVTEVETDETVN